MDHNSSRFLTVDLFSKKTRSKIMACVKSENTAPERLVRSLIHRLGFRFRLNKRDLPGKPDIVLTRLRTVVFVHGCFWHGHKCARGHRLPKANASYWRKKIARNRVRDRANLMALKTDHWKAVVVWECEIKDREKLVRKMQSHLSSDRTLGDRLS